MTCPNCRAAAVNAVLGKIVSRETIPVEADNARVLQISKAKEQWCDTFGGPRPRRFAEPREIGRPPVDPDAEQLALAVAEEMQRGRG